MTFALRLPIWVRFREGWDLTLARHSQKATPSRQRLRTRIHHKVHTSTEDTMKPCIVSLCNDLSSALIKHSR